MQVVFFQTFYNFARPHLSLRVPLEVPIEFPGCVKQKYLPMTPAVASGLTDHVWTFRELLTAKFGAVP